MKTRLMERNNISGRSIEPHPSLKSGEGIKMEQSVTINRSPDEIYSFWRQLENLPRFMDHIKSVTQLGDNVSHWVVQTSAGKELEWDARLIEDKPDYLMILPWNFREEIIRQQTVYRDAGGRFIVPIPNLDVV